MQCKFSCLHMLCVYYWSPVELSVSGSFGVNHSILQSIIRLTTILLDKFGNRSLPLTKGGHEKIVGRLSCFQNWGV